MEYNNIDQTLCISYEEKIDRSKQIILESLQKFSYNHFYIAWTGGKDSTTLLWLYHKVCSKLGQPLPRAMFIDEGSVFEEIIDLVDQVKKDLKVDVTIVKNSNVSEKADYVGDSIRVKDLSQRNQNEIQKLGYTDDFFTFEPESYVGNHLMKTVAMNLFLESHGIKALSTAIRWDEQTSRKKEEYFSPRMNPDHTRVHPILHFEERDIWHIIHEENIPFCSLYTQGYRSLGAKNSTEKYSDIPAWEQDLDLTPERSGRDQHKEEIMSQLRDLGYM